MDFVEILLILVIVCLCGLSGFLFFYYTKINKAINLFFEKGNIKDARAILSQEIEKNKRLEKELHAAINRIETLEGSAQISLQKMGIVRFNPFGDMGGNQSFAIAMLDQKNNGFVISSLFTKEGNRVYAKAITRGQSKHVLTVEEQDAISRAIKE